MKYLISNFSKWKKVHEAEMPGKTKEAHRVVGIPIDNTSFKIKIIGDLDVIDNTSGKVTNDGWQAILDWIKAQPKWLAYYPGLNDLTNNFIIYVVKRDNDRKQLITFRIEPRTSAPGLPKETQIVAETDLGNVVKNAQSAQILKQAVDKAVATKVDTTVPAPATPTPAVKINAPKVERPLQFSEILNTPSGKPLFNVVDDAYVALIKVPQISGLPFFPKVKAELKAGKLGENCVKLIKGIISAYKIKDKYGDQVDVLNQDVVNKLVELASAQPAAKNESRSYVIGIDGKSWVNMSFAGTTETHIFEEVAGVPAGFDLDAFTKEVSVEAEPAATIGASQKTGGINLPDGGIKQGVVAKGDSELKKAQQLIIDKLEPVLKTNPAFIKFKSYGADGDFGPTTNAVVALAKIGFDLKDQDGSTITAELINKLLTDKITESYLGVDYKIYEKFNVEAAEAAYAKMTSKGKEAAPAKKEKTTTKEETSTGLEENARKIQEILLSASSQIKAKFADTSFWQEFKGTVNDDEEGAITKFYKWWNTEFTPNYIKKAMAIYTKLPESKEKSICKENINTLIRAVVYKNGPGGLIAKLKSDSQHNDTFEWKIKMLDGQFVDFSVDTDF